MRRAELRSSVKRIRPANNSPAIINAAVAIGSTPLSSALSYTMGSTFSLRAPGRDGLQTRIDSKCQIFVRLLHSVLLRRVVTLLRQHHQRGSSRLAKGPEVAALRHY
jgi:hypothetical protein